jgi:hypothetical protein
MTHMTRSPYRPRVRARMGAQQSNASLRHMRHTFGGRSVPPTLRVLPRGGDRSLKIRNLSALPPFTLPHDERFTGD